MIQDNSYVYVVYTADHLRWYGKRLGSL